MTTLAPHYVDRLNTIRDRKRSARERMGTARLHHQAAMDRAQALPDLPRGGSPEAMELVRSDSELRAAEAELDAAKDQESFLSSQAAGALSRSAACIWAWASMTRSCCR